MDHGDVNAIDSSDETRVLKQPDSNSSHFWIGHLTGSALVSDTAMSAPVPPELYGTVNDVAPEFHIFPEQSIGRAVTVSTLLYVYGPPPPGIMHL